MNKQNEKYTDILFNLVFVEIVELISSTQLKCHQRSLSSKSLEKY